MANSGQGPSLRHASCKACGLYASCKSPFLRAERIDGYGGELPKNPILLIGETPTENDDRDGLFCSTRERKYTLLFQALKKFGVDLADCAYTAALRCAPLEGKAPTSKQLNACREFLLAEIERVQPRAILALGNGPLRALFKKSGVTKERRCIKTLATTTAGDIKCAVAFAPAYALRDMNQLGKFEGDIRFFCEEVLRVGVKRKRFVPEIDLYPTAKTIRAFHQRALDNDSHVSVDIESDELQTFTRADWKFLCAGVSDGKKTLVLEFDKCGDPLVGRMTTPLSAAQRALLAVIGDKRIRKVLHNGKYDTHAVWNRFDGKARVSNFWLDTMILHAHCFPITGGHDLKQVSSEILHIHDYTDELKPYVGDTKDKRRYGKVPYPILGKYCGYDLHCTANLVEPLRKRLMRVVRAQERDGVPGVRSSKTFFQIIMPCLRTFVDLERKGFQVRRKYVAKLSAQMEAEATELTAKVRLQKMVRKWERTAREDARADALQNPKGKMEGGIKRLSDAQVRAIDKASTFNPNSTPSVTALVYGKHYFNLAVKKKTATGLPATGIDVLEELAREAEDGGFEKFIKILQECKRVEHYKSTYVDGILPLLDPRGRVHASFKVYGAETGRTSCSDPNLQNQPRENPKDRVVSCRNLRNVFGSRKGCVLVDADYSQIELRLQAALSNDEHMVEVYKKGRDLHLETALGMYKVPAKQITAEQRQSAKPVNFGVIYCIAAPKLASGLSDDLGRIVEIDEAQQFIDSFFETYPGVEEWQMEQKQFAAEHGYVYTLLGTRRLLANATLKGVDYEQRRLREEAFRQACNTPIQGLAGLFTLIALTRLRIEYKRRKLPAWLVSTVHDDIITECEESCAAEVIDIKRSVMTKEPLRWCGKWLNGVPIVADFKVGTSWGNMQKPEVA